MAVTEHRLNKGKAPGRAAGRLPISIADGETGYLDFKVDTDEGKFIAIDGDMYFAADTKAELSRYMRDRARAARNVTWTRYIVIDYDCEGPGGFGQRRHIKRSAKLEPNAEGLIDDVGGLRIDWDVIDFSDPIMVPGWKEPRIKERHVFDSGATGREDWHRGSKLPDLAIPFSETVHDALKRMRHGLGVIHLGIAQLLEGSPAEIAARLAAAGGLTIASEGPKQLAAPEVPDDDD